MAGSGARVVSVLLKGAVMWAGVSAGLEGEVGHDPKAGDPFLESLADVVA
jgi:hypothetical protein